MRLLALAGLLAAASGSWAQEPGSVPQGPEPHDQEQTTAPTQKQTITVPAGTRVGLTLTNPIRSRAARKGDAIRAVTSFPVTVGTQVAIPAGTYLDGVIDKVTKRGPSGRAGLQAHFTRMVFSSGYNVALDGATAQAKAANPGANPSESVVPGTAGLGGGLTSGAMAFQQPPQPPPPPKLGPSIGLVTGISVGVAAAATVGAILLGRHRAGDVLFDAGYQFDMILENPLTLDAESVAAALNGPSAQ